jgi:hypothetical protein
MNDPYDTQVGGDHYKKMKIQPSEFINKNEMQFAEGNAIKYICRHSSKGRLQDLEKAKHYIDMIIERDYADEAKNSSVDSGVNITYEGLSVTLPESDPDAMDDLSKGFGTLSEDVKVSYADDELNDEIYYPSGASVGKEGFDE